jgi:hypothetical protein
MVEVKFLKWIQGHLTLLNNGLGEVSIGDLTMSTKACGLLWSKKKRHCPDV